MDKLQELADPNGRVRRAWLERAAQYRRDLGPLGESFAAVLESCARELEEAEAEFLRTALTVEEAAEISGTSYPTVRRWLDAGELTNVGEKGAPRVLLAELQLPKATVAGVLVRKEVVGRTKVAARRSAKAAR